MNAVKEENLKLRSENSILGQYIQNLMQASQVFQAVTAATAADASGGENQPPRSVPSATGSGGGGAGGLGTVIRSVNASAMGNTSKRSTKEDSEAVVKGVLSP